MMVHIRDIESDENCVVAVSSTKHCLQRYLGGSETVVVDCTVPEAVKSSTAVTRSHISFNISLHLINDSNLILSSPKNDKCWADPTKKSYRAMRHFQRFAHLSLFIRHIRSLFILSFFDTIFFNKSTEMSLSTFTVNVPPVTSLKFKVIFLIGSSIFIFFFSFCRIY